MAKQSNLAYDFERFEVQAQESKEKVKIKVVSQRQQKRQNRYFVAKVAACVTVFFVGVLGIILSQVAITEVTMQITKCNQRLELLQSDYRTLTAELESSMALNNIESIVTREMGMSKLRENQVAYVNFSDGDSVDTVETKNTSFFEKLKETFSKLMEYLKPSENTME